MRQKKLPPDILEFFRKQGAKGGRIGGSAGGKKAAAGMTPEERSARAKKASEAAAAARTAKARHSEKRAPATRVPTGRGPTPDSSPERAPKMRVDARNKFYRDKANEAVAAAKSAQPFQQQPKR